MPLLPLSYDDQQAIVKAHNGYRKEVVEKSKDLVPPVVVTPLPALKWSPDLATAAGHWATHLATVVHNLQHSGTPGENIARSTNYSSPKDFVDLWGNEWKNFDFKTKAPKESTGGETQHYTQIVWRATLEVGCGLAKDTTSNYYYFVARYKPPGNTAGAVY